MDVNRYVVKDLMDGHEYSELYAEPAYRNEAIRGELEEVLLQLRSAKLMSLDLRLFWRFLHPLEQAIETPESFAPELLSDCVSELTRVMTNMGVSGIDFAQTFDRIIHSYQLRNLSLVDLASGKAAYIGLERNEGCQND